MEMKVIEVKNLKHVEEGSILMDVHFEHIGKFIQFNACKHDSAEHGKKLYEDALRGVYGPIAPADPEFIKRKTMHFIKADVKTNLSSIKDELSALRDADELGIITKPEADRYKELRMYNISANRFLNSDVLRAAPPIFPLKAVK